MSADQSLLRDEICKCMWSYSRRASSTSVYWRCTQIFQVPSIDCHSCHRYPNIRLRRCKFVSFTNHRVVYIIWQWCTPKTRVVDDEDYWFRHTLVTHLMGEFGGLLQLNYIPWLEFSRFMGKMHNYLTNHCIVITIMEVEMCELHRNLYIFVASIFERTCLKSRISKLSFSFDNLKNGIWEGCRSISTILGKGKDVSHSMNIVSSWIFIFIFIFISISTPQMSTDVTEVS